MGNCIRTQSELIRTANVIDMYHKLPLDLKQERLFKNRLKKKIESKIGKKTSDKSLISSSTICSENNLSKSTNLNLPKTEDVKDIPKESTIVIEDKKMIEQPKKKKETMNTELKIKLRTYLKHHKKHSKNNINQINIALFGAAGVGKSAFTIKVVDQYFEKLYIPTLGHEIKTKSISIGGNKYILNFFSTSGDPQYKQDYSFLLSQTDFSLIFYDVTSPQSFEEAKKILNNDLSKYLKKYNNYCNNFCFVGNKTDMISRKVSVESINDYCKKENKFENFEISVKDEKGIRELINSLISKHIYLIEDKSFVKV